MINCAPSAWTQFDPELARNGCIFSHILTAVLVSEKVMVFRHVWHLKKKKGFRCEGFWGEVPHKATKRFSALFMRFEAVP